MVFPFPLPLLFSPGKIADYLKTHLKSTHLRHGEGDILDASCHFLREVLRGDHLRPKIQRWGHRTVARMVNSQGAEVADDSAVHLGHSWQEISTEKGSRLWARNLRVLDQLVSATWQLLSLTSLPYFSPTFPLFYLFFPLLFPQLSPKEGGGGGPPVLP